MSSEGTLQTSAPAPSSCNVYISKLYNADEDALRTALEGFGEITDLFLKRRSSFGFASFSSVASAEQACAASPITIGPDVCNVEMRQSKPFDANQRAAREPAPPSCHIYVNNFRSDESTLRNVLEGFGQLEDINVNEQGGYAFASFTNQDMSMAVVNASPITIGEDVCVVEMRRSAPRSKQKKKKKASSGRSRRGPPLEQQLYVKGLSSDTTEDDIFNALSAYGEVQNVYRRELRGEEEGWTDYAFVTFADSESVLIAAAENVMIAGSQVVVAPRRPRNSTE